MDKQMLAMFIPILALSIPVAAIVVSGMVKLQKTRLEQMRLQAEPDPGVLAELEELRTEVHQLRGELSEVQERLDFAERLLAARAGRPQLPGA